VDAEVEVVINQHQLANRIGRENWAQFALRDPKTEAAALSDLEDSFRLKRGWNVDGAANVYLRSKAALAAVGQDLLQHHRFRHRRWARDDCAKTCAAHDLYAYCVLCLPIDLHPRVMPISRLLGPLIAKALDYPFARSPSFHREVVRDLSHLRKVSDKPQREHSPADKSLLLRYSGTAAVLMHKSSASQS
jgi:hypothetical protein